MRSEKIFTMKKIFKNSYQNVQFYGILDNIGRRGGLLRGAGAPLNSKDFLILEALISFEKLKEISNY